MNEQLTSKTLVERLLQAADGICKGPGGEPYWWGEVALLGATEIEHLQQRVAELERFEKMYSEATDIQGDDEVLRYITSGNSIPVTRCTVSADLIRQLVEGRRSQPPTSPASKHDLSELHSWLVDMSNESSPYNSQMLMKAANVVAERLQVPPNLLHKDFDSWFATIGLSYWPRLQEVWTAARAPVTKTVECDACDKPGEHCSRPYGICKRAVTKERCLVEPVHGGSFERCDAYPKCPCGGPQDETSGPPELCGHDDGSWCDESCREKERKYREWMAANARANGWDPNEIF